MDYRKKVELQQGRRISPPTDSSDNKLTPDDKTTVTRTNDARQEEINPTAAKIAATIN
jgi:hypothetical protein